MVFFFLKFPLFFQFLLGFFEVFYRLLINVLARVFATVSRFSSLDPFTFGPFLVSFANQALG